MFIDGEVVIINQKASKGIPYRVGTRCVIVDCLLNSVNFDYEVEFDDSQTSPVRECELNKLTKEDEKYMEYIFTGNKVFYKPEKREVTIIKVDYINQQAEIEFSSGGQHVTGFDKLIEIEDYTLPVLEFAHEKAGKFTELALEIGQFTDMKNKQYGSSVDATYKMIQVLMERYTYDEENYLMPKDLLKHILLTVRVMDKQNRIFNNPSGIGDSESPWTDITGYGLIGIDMVQK